jgi:hypothetical protein
LYPQNLPVNRLPPRPGSTLVEEAARDVAAPNPEDPDYIAGAHQMACIGDITSYEHVHRCRMRHR